MRILFYFFVLGLLSFSVYGQKNEVIQSDMEDYKLHISKADSLYHAKEYKLSAAEFEKAFESNDGRGFRHDRYNAARSHALSKNIEKSFSHLFFLAEHPKIMYSNLNLINTDPDLRSLHRFDEWNKLLNIIQSNRELREINLDKELIAILDTIADESHKYRRQLNNYQENYGMHAQPVKDYQKTVDRIDSLHLIKVREILDNQGWLGPDIIGNRGSVTLFSVVQYADTESQEKYLPMLRAAVEKGDASANDLAILEDEVALKKGKRQIYGSQIGLNEKTGKFYILPLFDPDNVDKRRAEVGLSPIKDYVSVWDIKWDVEEHKRGLPEEESPQENL